jgi:hypothetical protein
MNWNDYEAVWKRQELPIGADADVAKLRQTFETKRRKLAATLLVRDLLESGAGLLACIVCGFLWWKLGPTGWPIGLAMALTLGVSAVFVRERLRSRQLRLGEAAPLLTKVEADLAELRHQRQLLHTIWRWYLGPLLTAILIIHFTLTMHGPAWSPQRDPVFNAGFVAFYLFCVGLVWLINYRAGRKQIDPRIAELDKLRRDLQAGDGNPLGSDGEN